MGATGRYISGFSCEKGMVESKEAMLALVKERKAIMKEFPNLVSYEARRTFQSWFKGEAMPEAGAPVEDVVPKQTFWGSIKHEKVTRGFARSSDEAWAERRKYRVAMPRVLNMYSTGILLPDLLRDPRPRQAQRLLQRRESSEEMFAEGGKYGCVDPCYPSKVVQAHIHHFLFEVHPKKRIDSIFFPILTHVPSYLEDTRRQRELSHRRGHAGRDEGGLHQGGRLLRHARHRVHRSGALLHGADPHEAGRCSRPARTG